MIFCRLVILVNLFCVYTQDPVQVHVGKARYVTHFSGSKHQKVFKSEFFHYIPLGKNLNQLLQQPDILGEIDNFHGSRDDILQDMCDGDMFKKHPLFSTDEKAIQIIAYYDEVELCNPLGSNTQVRLCFLYCWQLSSLLPLKAKVKFPGCSGYWTDHKSACN